MFKTIRLKIAFLLVLFIVAAEFIVGLFGVIHTKQDYKNDFINKINTVFDDAACEELNDAANSIHIEKQASDGEELIITDSGQENIENIKDIVMSKKLELELENSCTFYLLDNSGAVIFSSISSDVTQASDVISKALDGKEAINTNISGEYIDYALPLKSGDDVKYVIYIKDSLQVIDAVTDRLVSNLLLIVPISGLIVFIFALLFARSVTQPLKSLSAQAKRLADGDLNTLSRTDRTDEIGELTNALIYLSEAKQSTAEKVTAEKIKIEKILQNMRDGILAFDIKGKLTHINPEAQRLLSRKYVDDITFNKFFKEINADITLEALQYLHTDESIEREIRINSQVLQLSFAAFSHDSSEGGVIVIIHDITKHERLESARRDFVADVSHELRTPLTVIKSYADSLADSPDAPAELRTRFLDTISSETDRMTKIISDLLTLSKLDENANYTHLSDDIDIRSMLEGLVERLSLTAKKKNQTLIYTPINDVPHIKGDRDGLERVFTNIISNALKYTPTGGEIKIFSSIVYSDILIKVSDNGIGIPKENLPNIFDRFYRVDKARSRDKGGTGLGLAIAKETVEGAFHGKIIINSELNKGTDVTISLPARGTK